MRPGSYHVERLPRSRLLVIDLSRLAARQLVVHGLIEADVTGVPQRLRAMPGHPTVTAFVVATLGRAVRAHPRLNVRRSGRRLVVFDAVDVGLTVERELEGGTVPAPYVVTNADHKSVADIAAELRAARQAPVAGVTDLVGGSALLALPSALRRGLARAAGRIPRASAHFGPAVGVTSLGMFGSGWGLPLTPLTLTVTIGGVAERLALADGVVTAREVLPLTLSLDHAVVDGAPAARFAATFRSLLETAAVLEPVARAAPANAVSRADVGIPSVP